MRWRRFRFEPAALGGANDGPAAKWSWFNLRVEAATAEFPAYFSMKQIMPPSTAITVDIIEATHPGIGANDLRDRTLDGRNYPSHERRMALIL